MDVNAARIIADAIKGNTDELRKLRRSVDKLLTSRMSHAQLHELSLREKEEEKVDFKDIPAPPAEAIFVPPPPVIHLAFMDHNDPRPTCWQHSGIGAQFTITSFPEHVTCVTCLNMMAENQ